MDIKGKEEIVQDIPIIVILKIFFLQNYQNFPLKEKLILRLH